MNNEKTLKEIVKDVAKEMRCNCDLDNWEPEANTGHSWVCRIHKTAIARAGLFQGTRYERR